MTVYADHAATSWPKPAAVIAAIADYYAEIGVAAGRGTSSRAAAASRVLTSARRRLAELFAVADERCIVFTAGGTDGLNTVIQGTAGPEDRVLMTSIEHNAVARAVHATTSDVIEVPCDEQTRVDRDAWREGLSQQPTLACLNHACNVTGVIQDAATLINDAHVAGVPVLLDACQTAGHREIDWAGIAADYIATGAHKGLLGPLGVGVLVVRDPDSPLPRPLRYGGTGLHSEQVAQPAALPDRLEAGSTNVAAVAGLLAALNWDGDNTLDLTAVDEGLAADAFRFVIRTAAQLPTRAFAHRSLSSSDLAGILETSFGIEVRAGLQCAPLVHASLGTLDDGGLVRISFGRTSTQADVDTVAAALRELAAA